MNTRAPCRRARETLISIRQIRFKSTSRTVSSNEPVEPEFSTEVVQRRNYKEDKPNYKTYGSKIWNNFSLRQIPFNGKKTVPPALRKDLWHPFCAITFSPSTSSSSTAIGLSAYQKLREFRRRHELEWDQSEYMDPEGKNFLNKRQVGLKLCDQKANSVADMAYVFSRLALSSDTAVPKTQTAPATAKPTVEVEFEKNGGVGSGTNIGLIGDGTGAEVKIEWWDIRDAEFAQAWSSNVTHTEMGEALLTNNREQRKLWGRGKQRVEEQAALQAASAGTATPELV